MSKEKLCQIEAAQPNGGQPTPNSRLPASDPSGLCQIEGAESAGPMRRPESLYVPSRIFWNLRKNGFLYTARATFRAQYRRVAEQTGWSKPDVRSPDCHHEVLGLQPGELVEVRPIEEIRNTLNEKSQRHGLTFTPEMMKHCGGRYRVYKRLEYMFDEYKHTQRRLRNTVLLEGVVCTGEGIGCDRSCFLYWREAWLRRVEDESETR
jgi:hypothetical protein